MTDWLLIHYKLPPEPSALRVYVWRKLKRLGAIFFLESVWVLPSTSRNREQFQWLAAEIIEMGGEVANWEAQTALEGKDDHLVEQFQEQVNRVYAEILHDLEQPNIDLDALSRQYQQAYLKDYFQSELGQQVRGALLARRGMDA